VELHKGAYIADGTVLHATDRDGNVSDTILTGLPASEIPILLHLGDQLVLTADAAPGHPARLDDKGAAIEPAAIACTAPEVFSMVKAGEPVRLDDGAIGAWIESVERGRLTLRICDLPGGVAKLRGEKGINFPESNLELPALGAQDRANLAFVAENADAVELSFVQRPDDVREVQDLLRQQSRRTLGLVLKIETRRGFQHLPELLWAAMGSKVAGVMIARGDLAVECGWHRMAEVQEEILWLCEAAHLPVIWATQVLEGLAKEGIPSRAEITDAAMGERAECVMLNKGPHVVRTVAALDDILRRMQGHQSKKVPMLRQLRAWSDSAWPWRR
jgi:pyruvate kinase